MLIEVSSDKTEEDAENNLLGPWIIWICCIYSTHNKLRTFSRQLKIAWQLKIIFGVSEIYEIYSISCRFSRATPKNSMCTFDLDNPEIFFKLREVFRFSRKSS